MVNPTVRLEEIHRQNEGNPIILLARDLLDTGKINPKYCKYDNINIIKKPDIKRTLIDNNIDVLLTGTNKIRHSMNRLVRAINGFHEETPEAGESIICLKNSWDADDSMSICNGELFTISDSIDISPNAEHNSYVITNGRNKKICVDIHKEAWENDGSYTQRELIGEYGNYKIFDYGYAITVHKSQGSEFDHVMFFDEDVSYFVDRNKFRYTAVTRAKENLTIVRM